MQEAKEMQDTTYLLEIFDIAKYAVHIEDDKTYRNARQMLSEELSAYVTSQIQHDEVWTKGLDFLPVHIDLMRQILNMICKPNGNFFAYDCWLLDVWFNPIQYVPLSEDTFCFIWYFVTNVIDAGKEDWFMSYWTFADQYFRASFDLNSDGRNNQTFLKQKERFKQMHLGLGAYLLFKKKYSLLKKILKFTQTMPPIYSLLDNTFGMILCDMERIYELSEYPLMLTKKYMMSGLMSDVNTDSYIVGRFNAYFALLMVRLDKMDYNVSYCDPNSYPYIKPDSDISDLKEQLKYIGVLRHFGDDEELVRCLSELKFTKEQRKKAQNLLDGYQTVLENEIKNKIENPQTDSQKLEYIKQNLIEEIKRQKLYIPLKQDSLLTVDCKSEAFYIEQSYEVSKEDVAKFFDRISANMEEALIAYVLMQERQLYNSFFLFNKPVVSYTVRFRDLMRAWEKLKVDDNVVILSMGVYLGTFSDLYGKHEKFKYSGGEGSFNGAKILGLQSTMRTFVIMSRDSLPYIEHVRLSPGNNENDEKLAKNLQCIDEESCLYSNIASVNAEHNRILTVLRKVNLICKKGFTKYVVLKVEYRNENSLFDLEKIQGIENFISLTNGKE